ncbi:Uncharacterised protein [Mycobacteroides abscessus subsp. abscessus]|nr:Uncharacterised protein [Mycobacteroides abscessus subsp. abscessus]
MVSATQSAAPTTYGADTRALVHLLDDLTLRVAAELAEYGRT